MTILLLAIVQAGVCAGIVWSVICRWAKSDGDVKPEVRRAFNYLVICCIVAAVMPFRHQEYSLLLLTEMGLLASVGNLQWVTGKFWRNGTPDPFRDPVKN